MADRLNDFRKFEEMMNRMFEEFWGRPGRQLMLPSGEGERLCRLNQGSLSSMSPRPIYKEIIATAEMPGLEKQDIKINLTEDRLEISAEIRQEEKKEEKGYLYRERCQRKFLSCNFPSHRL